MYLPAVQYFLKNEASLLDFLGGKISGNKKVAIIGGHYMLFYDKAKDELKPVIWQELEIEQQKKFAEQNAGNFPVRSLRYSIELFKKLKVRNIKSGIILLVNDHKFQSVNFQSGIASFIAGRGGELRKKYFNKNIIPGCYDEILETENISKDEILFNNDDPGRQSGDLLPKKSWFYSEQKLRNRFDEFVKPELLSSGNIRQDHVGSRVDLYFESPNHNNDFCLTENGSCACSGEVIEFISNLIRREIFEIVFFVPNECASPVDNGVMAALSISGKAAKVWTVFNFGGMGFSENTNRPFTVTEHINE